MKNIHPIAGALALMILLAFWSATVFSEISGVPTVISTVKHAIVWGLPVLIAVLMTAAASGFRLGASWRGHPGVAAKRRRMPIIAANGIFVLMPSAIFLNRMASDGDFGQLFWAIQMLELCAGAINIVLLGLSFRDGVRLRRQPHA